MLNGHLRSDLIEHDMIHCSTFVEQQSQHLLIKNVETWHRLKDKLNLALYRMHFTRFVNTISCKNLSLPTYFNNLRVTGN